MRANQIVPLMFDRAEWMVDAACRGSNPAAWFPERGGGIGHLIATCQGCVVRQECADYAIDNCIIDGVWGGLSARERRRARVGAGARVRGVRGALEPCGTHAAYRRHLRHDETPCDACRQATSAYTVANRQQRRAV